MAYFYRIYVAFAWDICGSHTIYMRFAHGIYVVRIRDITVHAPCIMVRAGSKQLLHKPCISTTIYAEYPYINSKFHACSFYFSSPGKRVCQQKGAFAIFLRMHFVFELTHC